MVWSVVSRQSSMMVTAIIIPVKFQEKAKRFTKGEIAGNAGYSYLDGVTVYDNYYTGSGKKADRRVHPGNHISPKPKSIFDHIRKLLEAFFQILDILKQT